MDKKPDGGPAFAHGNPEYGGDPGMSLRDWFAGQALVGMNANPELLEVVTAGSILDGTALDRGAKTAYRFADAMIAARDKP